MKVTTLKGIFPDPKPARRKNFIHENVRNLRRMEQCFQSNKEVDTLDKLQVHKNKLGNKYQNVSAKVITTFRDRKRYEQRNDIECASRDQVDSVSIDKVKYEKSNQIGISLVESSKKNVSDMKKTIKTHIDNDNRTDTDNRSDKNILNKQKRNSKYKNEQKQQPKDSSKSNTLQKYNDNAATDSNAHSSVKYRNQGVQTLETDDIESIYSEGIIRHSTRKVMRHNEIANKGDLNRGEAIDFLKHSNSPTDRGDMRIADDLKKTDLRNSTSSFREEIDFVKLNKERTSVATKLATQLNGVPPPNYRKGVVPKYLRERKEAQEKEQKAKAEASYIDCPEGYVSLPDHERKETLRLLKKNYQDFVNELNMMPIRTDTLRAQKRKVEIEKQLTKLEEGIKVFSRPKVYVKINA